LNAKILLILLSYMARLRFWIVFALLAGGIAGPLLHAQLSEEEKRKRAAFLKAREEMRTVASPTPSQSPSAKPKPKAAKHPPKKKKAAKPKPTETPEPEESPIPKAKPTSKASATPERESPPRRAVAVPTATVTPPVAAATPAPAAEEPQVIVRKSGLEKPSGFSLIPFHLFGKHYQYLTRSVRAEIDRAPVLRRRWQFIVVHNSGTRQGNARIFDYYHRHVRRMVNGLAYHFVIGNGSSSGNGQIEVGARWRRQINGGHVHSDYLNNISLGICLVGDFNRDQPTRAQLDACEELIRYLRLRCGKIDAHFVVVRPHRDMNPPRWPTDCPGDVFPYSWFRRFQE
jgi:N-acetylmuramoyl-L-alanine amidase